MHKQLVTTLGMQDSSPRTVMGLHVGLGLPATFAAAVIDALWKVDALSATAVPEALVASAVRDALCALELLGEQDSDDEF